MLFNGVHSHLLIEDYYHLMQLAQTDLTYTYGVGVCMDQVMEQAITEQRIMDSWKNILGSGFDCEIYARMHAYIW
jgi:hypothetical protein